jgi:hypothetical protein
VVSAGNTRVALGGGIVERLVVTTHELPPHDAR